MFFCPEGALSCRRECGPGRGKTGRDAIGARGCYTGVMKGFWAILTTVFAAVPVFGTLRVSVGPEEIWLGDTVELRVSLGGEVLQDVEYTFSQPTVTLSRGTSVSSINGAISASLNLAVRPTALGPCRLESLTAVTQSGERLTYDGHPTVTVKALEPDPALKMTYACEPESLMPGDRFVLTLTLRVPGLRNGGDVLSPFLEQDFFRGMTTRPPHLTYARDLPEDGPIEFTSPPQWQPMAVDGTDAVWTMRTEGRARRAGEATLPAPVLRDTRYTEKDGNLVPIRCAALGKPQVLRVTDPPLEGRPAGYVGAIGSYLEADAVPNTLNAGVGDPVRLTVTLRTDCDPALLRAPTLPETEGFRPVGEPVRERLEGGSRWHYTLRPTKAGLLEIPAIALAWYDRAAARYATVFTEAVPIRVRPSASLVLLDESGVSLLSALPPPLRADLGEPFSPRPGRTAGTLLAAALAALLLRVLVRPLARLGRKAAGWLSRSPVSRAVSALDRTRDPAEALAAVRTALNRPALTAAALRAAAPDGADAEAFRAAAEAFAALEHAAYTDGRDNPEARAALRSRLPALARHLLPLLLLIVPVLPVRAAADDFVRDRATAVTCAAVTPADYADAGNLWLRLLREGDTGEAVWLNAASCAFLARDNASAVMLLRGAERRYGRTEDSERLRAALAARGLAPLPAWPPVWAGSFADRLDVLCFAAAAVALLWALTGRRAVRLSLFLTLLVLTAALLLAAEGFGTRSAPLPEAIVQPEETP